MGKGSELKLLGTAASPFVNRVQFALNLKSIKYEYIEENLACKSELLLTSNPVYKKVPVLLIADKTPICESQIIVEYLDEIQPDLNQFLPSDPLDRANCRFWAAYIDTKFFPYLYEELRKITRKEGQEAIKKQMMEAAQVLEEAFKSSNGKAYFGGDQIGYLDVILGSLITWIKFIDGLNDFNTFDETRVPQLAKWAKHITSHEALKSATPGYETLTSFYNMLNIYRPPYK